MKTSYHILVRSIISPFYRRNAALFTFLVFLLFGSFPGFNQCLDFHYYILLSAGKTLPFFLITMGIWVLYTFKALHFIHGNLQKKSYAFLRLLYYSSWKKRLLTGLFLSVLMLAPILLYGMAGVIIAVAIKNFTGAFLIFSAMMLITGIAAGMIIRMLKFADTFKISFPRLPLHKNLFHLLVRYMLNQQLILLLLLKLLTFSCLYFYSTVEPEVFDGRIAQLLFCSSAAGHCVLIYRNHHFMETQLSFYRNMPVNPAATILNLAACYLLVLLPECWALKGLLQVQNETILFIRIAVTGPLLLLLLHCLLYTEDMRLNDFLKLIFGVWIISIFFSLSSHWWIWPLICASLSVFIFLYAYHAYEKINEKAPPIES